MEISLVNCGDDEAQDLGNDVTNFFLGDEEHELDLTLKDTCNFCCFNFDESVDIWMMTFTVLLRVRWMVDIDYRQTGLDKLNWHIGFRWKKSTKRGRKLAAGLSCAYLRQFYCKFINMQSPTKINGKMKQNETDTALCDYKLKETKDKIWMTCYLFC